MHGVQLCSHPGSQRPARCAHSRALKRRLQRRRCQERGVTPRAATARSELARRWSLARCLLADADAEAAAVAPVAPVQVVVLEEVLRVLSGEPSGGGGVPCAAGGSCVGLAPRTDPTRPSLLHRRTFPAAPTASVQTAATNQRSAAGDRAGPEGRRVRAPALTRGLFRAPQDALHPGKRPRYAASHGPGPHGPGPGAGPLLGTSQLAPLALAHGLLAGGLPGLPPLPGLLAGGEGGGGLPGVLSLLSALSQPGGLAAGLAAAAQPPSQPQAERPSAATAAAASPSPSSRPPSEVCAAAARLGAEVSRALPRAHVREGGPPSRRRCW